MTGRARRQQRKRMRGNPTRRLVQKQDELDRVWRIVERRADRFLRGHAIVRPPGVRSIRLDVETGILHMTLEGVIEAIETTVRVSL